MASAPPPTRCTAQRFFTVSLCGHLISAWIADGVLRYWLRQFEDRDVTMLDALFVVATLAFFVLGRLYVRACELI
jgi:hypothetical protein